MDVEELKQWIKEYKAPLPDGAIRSFAVHRKNWLFSDIQVATNANTTMYSLIESAKLNNLNIWKYINYLL